MRLGHLISSKIWWGDEFNSDQLDTIEDKDLSNTLLSSESNRSKPSLPL
jgi:hypothetical protein